jgi:hypothetical protein
MCLTLPHAASAQPAAPPAPPVPQPPAAATAAPNAGAPVVVVPNAVIYLDPYHAATPYNPTVVNQAVPNPAWNRPVTTLPCDIPNLNTDPYAPAKPGCKGWFKKKGCGCSGGSDAGGAGDDSAGHKCAACSKGGSCTTCCNTDNFIFGSSRSFFGESSREFFERPPSIDGVKMCPKAYKPPPAPAAFTPATMVFTGQPQN